MVSLRDLMYPAISLASFQALRTADKKRICFGSVHKNALKPGAGGRATGYFNVPFIETIGMMFPWELFRNKNQFGGYFRAVADDDEFNEIRAWMAQNADVVFIRSLLNTAVATCEHYAAQDTRSRVGALEHSAKWNNSAHAREQLAAILLDVFHRMHGKRRIDAIASVPPSTPGNHSLPNLLAARISEITRIPDMSAELCWNARKPPIKELRVEEKWGALERVGISVGEAVAEKNVVLIDDMYQSGATVHFVAGALRAAGANDLHLLAVSKGRRDTDNT